MFIPLKFESVNSQNDLLHREYASTCRLYGAGGKRVDMVYFEYADVETNAIGAVDVVVLKDGNIHSCKDFVLRLDGRWRDSAGAIADAISQLMPDYFLDYVQTSQHDLGPVIRSQIVRMPREIFA